MPARPLSNEVLLETLKAYNANGRDCQKTSVATGMPRSTIQSRIAMAHSRNLTGEVSGRELNPGERITGVSTLYGPDGSVNAEWVKTARDKIAENAMDAITASLDAYKGKFAKTPAPKAVNSDLLTLYNIADHHLGLYSWANETGSDYDLDIGSKLLRQTMHQLVDMAPPSETAVILNLGDFFHADNSDNQTSRSKHALDVDTRFAKVLQTGVNLLVECVHLALKKHKRVIIRCLPGNHDDHSALMLSIAIENAFSKEKRVEVDTDPGRFWYYLHGKTMLAATHGDKTKLLDLPGTMASKQPQEWGASEYRYAFSGHVHHQTKVEKHGAICETMPTLAAKDAWAASKGFSANRAMISITFDKNRGEYLRHTVNVAYK